MNVYRDLFFQFQMNKEERETCELEDNFVSLIHKFIVSFPKLISGPKSYRDFRETDPRVPK